MGRALEITSTVLVAVALLLGGRLLLAHLVTYRPMALVVLVALAIIQFGALLRNAREAGSARGLRATRDMLFVAAALLAVAYVSAPARWSLGTCIVTAELGLALELLTQVVPQ